MQVNSSLVFFVGPTASGKTRRQGDLIETHRQLSHSVIHCSNLQEILQELRDRTANPNRCAIACHIAIDDAERIAQAQKSSWVQLWNYANTFRKLNVSLSVTACELRVAVLQISNSILKTATIIQCQARGN